MINIEPLARKIILKISRIPARVKFEIFKIYTSNVQHLVSILTNRYWLIDYLPRHSSCDDKVLLIKLDLIGDFIIWLDAAKEFRSLYPGKKIVLYANAVWSALAVCLPYWDEVISVDMTRLREDDLYRLRLLYRTHVRGFDIAIQPTFSREYMVDLIIRATHARLRIGHLGDLNNITSEDKAITDSWYTQLTPQATGQEAELNINAHLIRTLGNPHFLSRVPTLNKLIDLPVELTIKKPYCVIVPGASWDPKRWATESFAEIARELYAKHGLSTVLCGTSSERGLCNSVANLAGAEVLNFAGQTTLIEMVEVIRNARLLIANDSAAIHIATAARTAAVCVLGGGHFGRFLPYQPEVPEGDQILPIIAYSRMDCYGCRWRCHYPIAPGQPVPCISRITVSQVLNECEALLDEIQNRSKQRNLHLSLPE